MEIFIKGDPSESQYKKFRHDCEITLLELEILQFSIYMCSLNTLNTETTRGTHWYFCLNRS